MKREHNRYQCYELQVKDAQGEVLRTVRTVSRNPEIAQMAILSFSDEQVALFFKHEVSSLWKTSRDLKRKDLLVMIEGLHLAFSMGIALEQALRRVAHRLRNPWVIGKIAEVNFLVTRKGKTLAESMAEVGGFPDDLISSVQAGQNSGNLQEVLQMFLVRLTTHQALFRKLIGSSAYPALLVLVAIVAFIGLGLFILPQTAVLFEESGYPLPAVTQWMLEISHGLTSSWWRPLLGIFFLGGVFSLLRKGMQGPHGLRLLHAIPQLGPLITGLFLLRPLQTWGILVRAGIPLTRALVQVSVVCRHPQYRAYFLSLAHELSVGKSIEEVLHQQRRDIPEGVDLAIFLGSVTDTGDLNQALTPFLAEFEARIDTQLVWLPKLMEPLLLSAVFALVLFIVVAAILPGVEFLRQSLTQM